MASSQVKTEFKGSSDIDKLIKKFSYSINKPTEDANATYVIEDSVKCVSKAGESHSSDKAKFFNTLKSLFAIFDPECKGFIDLHELNSLGAQKNEILNDVISHLLHINKKHVNYEYSNNLYCSNNKNSDSRSSSGNSSRSSSANSSQLNAFAGSSKLEENKQAKPRVNTKEVRSPSANQISKKLKQSSVASSPSSTLSSASSSTSSHQLKSNLDGYYVTFEEFANAAEIVLDKRKQEKQLAAVNHSTDDNQLKPVGNHRHIDTSSKSSKTFFIIIENI